MPIYEFKCLQCGQYTEILLIKTKENIEIKCSNCASTDLDRVISTTKYSLPSGSQGKIRESCSSTRTRNCSSGSCTTYNISGPA